MITEWLTSYANESDLREVEAAVAQAEKRTAGEIVPMIVKESTLSGHVPVIASLLIYVILITVVIAVGDRLPGPSWAYDLALVLVSPLLGFMLAKNSGVRRLLTSKQDQVVSVLNRAQLEFHETGIPLTEGRTGVLIFVSLQERQAVILGDESISSKLDEKTWVDIVDGLLKHMKARRLKDGYIEAIAKVGAILEREFPIKPGDTNELPNSLVIKV
jgi:putative membrane protein